MEKEQDKGAESDWDNTPDERPGKQAKNFDGGNQREGRGRGRGWRNKDWKGDNNNWSRGRGGFQRMNLQSGSGTEKGGEEVRKKGAEGGAGGFHAGGEVSKKSVDTKGVPKPAEVEDPRYTKHWGVGHGSGDFQRKDNFQSDSRRGSFRNEKQQGSFKKDEVEAAGDSLAKVEISKRPVAETKDTKPAEEPSKDSGEGGSGGSSSSVKPEGSEGGAASSRNGNKKPGLNMEPVAKTPYKWDWGEEGKWIDLGPRGHNPPPYEPPTTKINLWIQELMNDCRRDLLKRADGSIIADCRANHGVYTTCMFCEGRNPKWAKQYKEGEEPPPDPEFEAYRQRIIRSATMHRSEVKPDEVDVLRKYRGPEDFFDEKDKEEDEDKVHVLVLN